MVYGYKIEIKYILPFIRIDMRDIFSLENKQIIVTGATGLVGSALAIALADFGAKLIVVAKNEDKLKNLCLRLSRNSTLSHSYFKLDMESEQDVLKFLESYIPHQGPVHGIVHCAMARPGQKNLHNQQETFGSSVLINAISSFLIWDRISKLMSKNCYGSLVYIGSIYGTVSPDFRIYEGTNMGTEPDYMFLKAGMMGLSRYYANKYGHLKVRSNVITLGGVFNNQDMNFVAKYRSKASLNRMATPTDVVGACVYLLSDASQYVSGSEIRVDGGYLSR
jgi:NAD(P)-dependent dehydrogenase (short-subunit alcohol dehydrogenase family)